MVTEENNTQLKTPVETNSARYGNETSVADVFDDLVHPKPPALDEAPTATDLLTDTEPNNGDTIDG